MRGSSCFAGFGFAASLGAVGAGVASALVAAPAGRWSSWRRIKFEFHIGDELLDVRLIDWVKL